MRLKSLRINADVLLEVVKMAAARGDVVCDGLSGNVNVRLSGRSQHAAGFFFEKAGGGHFHLNVESEEFPDVAEGSFLEVLEVKLREE